MKYKCETHGDLSPAERVIWNKGSTGGPWCMHCVNELMNKFFGRLIKYNDKEISDE
jgi:hypothetical protein